MQGYNGKYSHKNKFALDFRLRKGKSVCAARSGKVIKMVEHNNEGGGNIKFVSKANYVVIDHGDGTYAGYWHLEQNGALVEVGDLVKVAVKGLRVEVGTFGVITRLEERGNADCIAIQYWATMAESGYSFWFRPEYLEVISASR